MTRYTDKATARQAVWDALEAGRHEALQRGIELAILAELGHRRAPIATTVHDVQVVDALPQLETDLSLAPIANPTRTLVVEGETEASAPRIHWDRFDHGALDAMPVLRALRDRQTQRADDPGDTT